MDKNQWKMEIQKATETIKKFDELQKITTDPVYPVEVNLYPSTSSRQLKLVYEVKPTISFELFFDKEIKKASDVEGANIGYECGIWCT